MFVAKTGIAKIITGDGGMQKLFASKVTFRDDNLLTLSASSTILLGVLRGK